MNQLLLISNNDAKELLIQPKDFILLQSRSQIHFIITRSIYGTFSNKALESKMKLNSNNLGKRNECFLRGITLDSNIPSYETRRCIT